MTKDPESSQSRMMIRMLCVWSYAKRALRSQVQPGVKRMRARRQEFYETMWRSAAEAVGARYTILTDGSAEIAHGNVLLTVKENQISLDDRATIALADDKLRVCRLLALSGIPVSRHVVTSVGAFDNAVRWLTSSPVPLVVKPAADTGAGAGVSTSITTIQELRIAMAWARAYGPRILIEEQIEGDCYRVLIMDGEVIDCVQRRPPRVVGDGKSTVGQLVHRENKLRRLGTSAIRAQGLIRRDPDLHNSLARQGLRTDSRPSEGHVVVLKRVINDNATRDNVPANGELCAAILECARKSAKLVGARLAGVDLICSDPRLPLERTKGVVIEVNTNPGLYYHYRTEDRGFPIAEKVLSRALNMEGSHQHVSA